jgi:ferric-dicitrate binding protein FerR (iron transport regulator)
MSDARFVDVLEICISDIVAGRRTVADCLAEWPQFSDELAPLLEAASAVREQPAVAERPPDPARRAQFMAALRETPQQSPRARPLRAISRLFAGPLSLPALALPPLGLPAPGRAGMMASAAAVLVVALAVTLVLGGGTTTAYASTVTIFSGDVEVLRGDSWQQIDDGATLDEGVRLRTGAGGSAVLTFADGSTVGVEAETELLVELVRLNGNRRILLQQFSGRLWNDVVSDERSGSLYVVQTPDVTVTAQGTLFETAVEDDETTVSTSEGLVEVESGDERTFVAPGEVASAKRRGGIGPVQASATTGRAFALTVNAPFTAAIVAPDGKATGVRPDGIAFQQIAGAATSHPSQGSQLLELHRPTPGTYQLHLRRVGEGDGDGEVVLTLGNGREMRVPVERLGDAVRIELRVEVVDGRMRVTPLNPRLIEAHERDGARVVVTDAAQRRARPPKPPGQPERPSDGGEQREQLPPGLQDRALDKLRERLQNDSDGRLRELLESESGKALRERLEERARNRGNGSRGDGNREEGDRGAPGGGRSRDGADGGDGSGGSGGRGNGGGAGKGRPSR